MRASLEAILVERPEPTLERPQGLCLSKRYDDEPRALAAEFGFTLHLRTRSEEIGAKRHAGAKARRWVADVVFAPMTKADVPAFGADRQHVADLGTPRASRRMASCISEVPGSRYMANSSATIAASAGSVVTPRGSRGRSGCIR